MKIIYLGYDFYAGCFRLLVDDPRFLVEKVYSFPADGRFETNRKLISKARELGIPVSLERPAADELSSADLVISAGYPYRIPVSLDFKGINIHPELLPRGRGPWPMPHVILKSLPETGVTIHKLAEGFDTGDILIQKSFAVTGADTLDTLSEKSGSAAEELLRRLMEDFSSFWDAARPQGPGEYWPEPKGAARTITCAMGVSEIDRISRAFGSYGVLFPFNRGVRPVRITAIQRTPPVLPPGTFEKHRDQYVITLRDGTIRFKEQL